MSVKRRGRRPAFSADQVTGMFISMMFAGHHTTSGTAAWTLIEMLGHPEVLADVIAELDDLYADGSEVSYQALREIPRLEAAGERGAAAAPAADLAPAGGQGRPRGGGLTDPGRQAVGASIAVSNRIPEDFADARRLRARPLPRAAPRGPDNPWTWIPFGAGRHRCVGAAVRP